MCLYTEKNLKVFLISSHMNLFCVS